MSVPTDLRYTKDHEWVRLDGDTATVGVTAYAADQLGDIVFVELPDVGRPLAQSATFGVVESVKAVSDVYSPLTGEVVEVNDALQDEPQRVNEDCYGEGWLIRVRMTAPGELGELMDAEAYKKFLDEA